MRLQQAHADVIDQKNFLENSIQELQGVEETSEAGSEKISVLLSKVSSIRRNAEMSHSRSSKRWQEASQSLSIQSRGGYYQQQSGSSSLMADIVS